MATVSRSWRHCANRRRMSATMVESTRYAANAASVIWGQRAEGVGGQQPVEAEVGAGGEVEQLLARAAAAASSPRFEEVTGRLVRVSAAAPDLCWPSPRYTPSTQERAHSRTSNPRFTEQRAI